MRASRIAALVLVAAVVTACSTSADVEVSDQAGPVSEATTSAATTTATATTPAPGLRPLAAVGKGTGYTISVPASWTSIDPSAGSPEEIAKKISELYPSGADQASLAAAVRQGLVLFAIDPATGANVNVLVQDVTLSLDTIAAQIDTQLGALGAAPATVTRPTIGGRPALRADTSLASPAAALTQLYLVTATQTLITTITSPAAAKNVPVDAMAASVTIA